MARTGGRLPAVRLRELLLGRIAGCDIDAAAIRLAAFSLYVAFLNYQSPQDIRRSGPLPRLIRQQSRDSSDAPLVVADAFGRRKGEEAECVSSEDSSEEELLPWDMSGFDVVVGNPPWTRLKGKEQPSELWANRLGRPYSDRSPSQLFLWRALDLLASDGVAALLVSAKAMFNSRTRSKQFRQEWLSTVRLEHIVNFSHVRRDFFAGAAAPFMLLRFRPSGPESPGMVVYETARSVPRGRRRSSALVRLDRRIVSQASLKARDYLWKTYSAGSFHDDAFLARLETEQRLRDFVSGQLRGYGFQIGDATSGSIPPSSLRDLPILSRFESWGPHRDEWYEPLSPYVKIVPNVRLFRDRRLLVRRGVTPGFGPHARLETEPLAFRHQIYAVSLDAVEPWQASVILGTLLSSLGRYWLYMVSGSWGSWKDEVRSQDLLNLPIRLTSETNHNTQRIVRAVDELPNAVPRNIQHAPNRRPAPNQLITIDNAVAELFDLTEAERDLVDDFWTSHQKEATHPVEDGSAESRRY